MEKQLIEQLFNLPREQVSLIAQLFLGILGPEQPTLTEKRVQGALTTKQDMPSKEKGVKVLPPPPCEKRLSWKTYGSGCVMEEAYSWVTLQRRTWHTSKLRVCAS